jgi:hypothetical protein
VCVLLGLASFWERLVWFGLMAFDFASKKKTAARSSAHNQAKLRQRGQDSC